MAKDFYIKFVPADWLSDQNLRRCSHAARGVWIDLICLMFQCDEPGRLVTAGVPWTVDDVCAALGGQETCTRSCVAELLAKGVARMDARGAIFNDRMTREAALRNARAKAGSKGGNVTRDILLKQNGQQSCSKRAANMAAKEQQNPNSNSSSNSDSLSESSKQARENEERLAALHASPEFTTAWEDWLAMRREKRKPATATSRRNMLAKLAKWGPERAIAALQHSTANGWDGIYEPGESHGSTRTNQRGGAPANAGTYGARYADQHRGPDDRLSRVVERIPG